MTVYLAADHRGFELKNALRGWLESEGHEVVDVGAKEYNEGDDFPDFGIPLAEKVAGDSSSLGVAICGSGVGMAVVAGKIKGIRAVVANDPKLAAAGRRDDNVNVIALGSKYLDAEKAREVVKTALETSFSGAERQQRRIDKIARYENG